MCVGEGGGGVTAYCAAPCVWKGSYPVLCCTVCVYGGLPCTVLHRVSLSRVTTYCAALCVWRGSYHVLCCTVCVEGELPRTVLHRVCGGGLPRTVLHCVCGGGITMYCAAPCVEGGLPCSVLRTVCGEGCTLYCVAPCVWEVTLYFAARVCGGGGRLPRTLLHRAADVAQLHDVHTQTTLVFEVQCHPHWTVPPRLLDTLSVYLVLAATSTDNPDILGQTVGHTL